MTYEDPYTAASTIRANTTEGRNDEAFSVVHAKLAPGAIIARAFLSDPNQVLYFFILHFWIARGEREFTLRLPSAIFAVGTVPSVYLLAKRLFGRWPGVVAAAALALNAFFIHFGQEARGYSLTLLLVTLQILFFIRALETRGWTAWVAYAAAGAGACYVHVFSLIAPAIHLCAGVWRPGVSDSSLMAIVWFRRLPCWRRPGRGCPP